MKTLLSRTLMVLTLCGHMALTASDSRLRGAEPGSDDEAKAASTAATPAPDKAAGSEASDDQETYLLRYKFERGEKIRWKVIHRSKVRTVVSGTAQTAETVSISTKQWRVTTVKPDGTAVFAHLVEDLDMRQRLTDRDEVRYCSREDEKPPLGFEDVAKAVGRPLSVITLDDRGTILERQARPVPAAVSGQGQITIPLPEEPVAVGDVWSVPHDIDVPLPSGAVKKVKSRQNFALQDVKTGVATIRVATQILTPIHDPAIEAQLIQRESAGTVKFDIAAGRILQQRMDVDKRVIGFRGQASSLHYLTRFTEELLDEQPEVAAKSATADGAQVR